MKSTRSEIIGPSAGPSAIIPRRPMHDTSSPSRTQVRVRYGEVDRMGFVYHAHYLAYFEQGRTEWLRARGTTYREMEESGLLLVVVDVGLQYRAPAHYDDELVVTTRLAEQRAVRLRFEYEVRRGDELLTTGHTVLACTDAAGKPRRMPPIGAAARQAPGTASKPSLARPARPHAEGASRD